GDPGDPGDTTPPVISAVAAGGVTSNRATVTWTTDEPATSQARYGPTASYGSTTTLDTSLAANHSQTLTGLTASTTYHYQVVSRDAAGNERVSGDFTFTTQAPDPTAQEIGAWAPVMNWPLVAVHMALMPSGKILMWDAWETTGTPSARVWDPASQSFTNVPHASTELFCAGHAMLADGRLLVIGGHNGAAVGIRDTNIFDSLTNTWTRVADMHHPRWYPTAVTLSDGRVLALGGQSTPGVFVTVPEVYDPASNTWALLEDADLDIGEYPFAYAIPDGKVFIVAGPDYQSRTLDVATQTWTAVDEAPIPTGTAAMYEPGKVIATGGGTLNADPVISAAAIIDMTATTPAWQQTAPMANRRFQHNLVVLPDGQVLAIGGATQYSLVSTNGVLAAEMWDPNSGTWSTMASMQDRRMYHSTALLLPDGRVLAAGGGRTAPAPDFLTGQIYSPPYLFNGPRPTISNAPTATSYGATMTVQTPDAAGIASVALVRLGSVTHAVDFDQRRIPLTFSTTADGLSIQAPASPNVAPPGDYMLFLVNSAGVPSIAPIVRIGGTAPSDTEAPTVTLTAPADGAIVSGAA
ncbi:MAG: galactose oxidase-like domain-containing protein, partial [Vicinamibacterales bacterium]